jgi:hypothetical protein
MLHMVPETGAPSLKETDFPFASIPPLLSPLPPFPPLLCCRKGSGSMKPARCQWALPGRSGCAPAKANASSLSIPPRDKFPCLHPHPLPPVCPFRTILLDWYQHVSSTRHVQIGGVYEKSAMEAGTSHAPCRADYWHCSCTLCHCKKTRENNIGWHLGNGCACGCGSIIDGLTVRLSNRGRSACRQASICRPKERSCARCPAEMHTSRAALHWAVEAAGVVTALPCGNATY